MSSSAGHKSPVLDPQIDEREMGLAGDRTLSRVQWHRHGD